MFLIHRSMKNTSIPDTSMTKWMQGGVTSVHTVYSFCNVFLSLYPTDTVIQHPVWSNKLPFSIIHFLCPAEYAPIVNLWTPPRTVGNAHSYIQAWLLNWLESMIRKDQYGLWVQQMYRILCIRPVARQMKSLPSRSSHPSKQ